MIVESLSHRKMRLKRAKSLSPKCEGHPCRGGVMLLPFLLLYVTKRDSVLTEQQTGELPGGTFLFVLPG